MAFWTPDNMDNAQVWLKGGAGQTYDTSVEGGRLTAWGNQVADTLQEAQFSQTVAGKRPALTALNSLVGGEFDGSNDFLQAGDTDSLDSLGTFLMAVVIKPTLDTSARAIMSKGTANANGSFSWRITGTGNSSKLSMVLFDVGAVNSISMESAASPFASDTDNVCLVYKTASTARHRVNGSDSGPGPTNAFMNSVTGNVTNVTMLGEFQGGGCDPLDGNIYEVVAAADPFSNTEDIVSVEGYLAHRFGLESKLPSAHKYSAFAPAFGLVGNHNNDVSGEISLDISGKVASDGPAGVI
jgi:hypothetical protein